MLVNAIAKLFAAIIGNICQLNVCILIGMFGVLNNYYCTSDIIATADFAE